jgi:hypothetical protein
MPAMSIRALALAALATTASSATSEVSLTVLRHQATGGDWAQNGSNRIAYALVESDGYYRVHLMDPDGGNDVGLGAASSGLPRRHVGPAAWHASGRYLGVIAEKQDHAGGSFPATPGFGGYSDLYALAADASWSVRLVEEPNDYDHGLLFPFFSRDGRRMSWTERVAQPNLFVSKQLGGYWVIHVADVVETDGRPHLENIGTFEPGGRSFKEGYGFSPDGTRILFCSNQDTGEFLKEEIYSIDSVSGSDLRKLTSGGYNEHAFWTPDMHAIVWMSSQDNIDGSTDWWMMAPDGSNKRRISYMNVFGHNGYDGTAHYAGFGSFAPDGKRFVGGYQTNLITQETTLAMVDLPTGEGGTGSNPGGRTCGTGSSGLIVAAVGWLALTRRRRRPSA